MGAMGQDVGQGVPHFYVRLLADLEDYLNEVWGGMWGWVWGRGWGEMGGLWGQI